MSGQMIVFYLATQSAVSRMYTRVACEYSTQEYSEQEV